MMYNVIYTCLICCNSLMYTPVRFDLQMHPFLVVDECGVCFESCTTISAEVGLEITVDRGKVYPQCCTSIKLFPTDIARKWFFS